MQLTDDHRLMEAFQERGDFTAFEELFRRHRAGLHRFLLRLSGDPTVAEEVSQQTWLKLIELAERGKYRRSAAFRTTLYSLARNRWMDEYVRRHEATRTVALDEVADALPSTAEGEGELIDLLSRRQGEAALNEALAALPSEQREVLALWMQGFELVDVARVTGAPWHTVVSRKRYALEKIRRRLQPLREGASR